MSVVSESEKQEGRIVWGLTMDVSIAGIELPFRLRIVSDDEEKVLEALSDFSAMILKKAEETLE